MKTPLFAALSIFTIACNNPRPYYLTIEGKEPSITTGAFYTKYDKDTIFATTDTAAYEEAYLTFISHASVYKNYGLKDVVGYPESIRLIDNTYKDIIDIIPEETKRRIQDRIIRASSLTEGKDTLESILKANNREAAIVDILKASYEKDRFDTIGLYKAPVTVLYSVLINKDYSTYRDISLRYKNVSDKKITAIRFKWYGVNAFNKPADMGSSIGKDGFGGGFTEDVMKPGSESSGTWGIMSRDGKKVVLAWPIEVAFEDGTSWKIGG